MNSNKLSFRLKKLLLSFLKITALFLLFLVLGLFAPKTTNAATLFDANTSTCTTMLNNCDPNFDHVVYGTVTQDINHQIIFSGNWARVNYLTHLSTTPIAFSTDIPIVDGLYEVSINTPAAFFNSYISARITVSNGNVDLLAYTMDPYGNNYANLADNPPSQYVTAHLGSFTPGQYYHFQVIYDGTNLNVYYNYSLVFTKAVSFVDSYYNVAFMGGNSVPWRNFKISTDLAPDLPPTPTPTPTPSPTPIFTPPVLYDANLINCISSLQVCYPKFVSTYGAVEQNTNHETIFTGQWSRVNFLTDQTTSPINLSADIPIQNGYYEMSINTPAAVWNSYITSRITVSSDNVDFLIYKLDPYGYGYQNLADNPVSEYVSSHLGSFTPNQYYHFQVIYDGTTIYVYFDNNLIFTKAIPFYTNDKNVAFMGGNSVPWKNLLITTDVTLPTPTPTVTPTPTSTPTPTPTPRQITVLNPAKIWVGLKNSDDVGTKFDLLAEVYKNDLLVSSGQLDNVRGGSSGFNNAKLNTLNFNSFSPIEFPEGSTLKLKLYVRNACVGPTHNSGTARLWFNDTAANSQFNATIAESSNNYFLRDGFTLSTAVGSGPKKTIDIAAGSPCSPFKSFGTWTITP